MIPLEKTVVPEEAFRSVEQVLRSGRLTAGPMVGALEETVARTLGCAEAVACASEGAGLEVVLEALDVGPGDEVVVPAFAYVQVANAVLARHATPVLVDVDLENGSLDPSALRKVVSSRTRAVLAVHLYGQPAPIEGIRRVLEEASVQAPIVSDASHAFGAKAGGRSVGTLGECTVFSLGSGAHLPAGEGGIVTTDDTEIASRIRSNIDQGAAKTAEGPADHLRPGHNLRLTEMQAAIALAQLDRLPNELERRRAIAKTYDAALRGLEQTRSQAGAIGTVHAYGRYTVVTEDRGALVLALRAADIGYAVQYDRPLNDHPHLASYGHSRLGNAKRLADRVLQLPIRGNLTSEEVDQVVAVLRASEQP